ncbi:MAG: acyl--CoA ligase [Candidatus Brocadiaceae bacterium]|nr:acyl--CoA ligase [Candidatus Brocadiaceae bacterium]
MDKTDNKMLPQWICECANTYPERTAIIYNKREITYAELCDHIQRLSGALISLGVKRGDRVVLLLDNSPEFIISFFAIVSVSATAVPLNVHFKDWELANLIRNSEAKVIIASELIIPLPGEITSFGDMGDCVVIGTPEGKNGAYSFKQLLEENPPLTKALDMSLQDEVLLQYTSGSTGQPKKIVRTHFNLVSEAKNYCSTVNMTSNDNILCVIPLFHSHGFGNCMLASVYASATLVILEEFNRRNVMETIQEESITVFPGVPFMFNMLADTNLRDKINVSSLRLCFSAGAPLMQKTVQKFYEKYGVFVRQLYGSTETGSISINLDDDISYNAESVGKPMRNIEVEIFDMDGKVLKANEVGNIGIRSSGMTKGYLGIEELNRNSFKNGYFFPGDLGYKDEKGNLYITGRKTLFINAAGNKVDPTQIEKVIITHPKVEEVVVVGIKGNYGEEVIKAVVVLNNQCDESELIEFCRGKIAEFKIPRLIEFRKEIPKSPIGKILRKYLLENTEMSETSEGSIEQSIFQRPLLSTESTGWLDVSISPKFQPLANYDYRQLKDYHLKVIPYLKNRGIEDDAGINKFVMFDLNTLAHALTIIFESDKNIVLQSILPSNLFRILENLDLKIDHVGRELFGPLEFYLNILREQSDKLELEHIALPEGENVTEYGDIIFQSVQVVEALRHFDQHLKGVTIGKIYFKNNQDQKSTGCLELFQVAPRDGSSPQNYRYTLARLANLYANPNRGQTDKMFNRSINKGYITDDGKIPLVTPICHISIKVNELQTVYDFHNAAKNDKSGMIILYLDKVSSNPGDGSINTKIAIRTNSEIPLYNIIIEVAFFR